MALRLPSVIAAVVLAPACGSNHAHHDAPPTGSDAMGSDTCGTCISFTGSMGEPVPCGCVPLGDSCPGSCVCAAECFPPNGGSQCGTGCAGSNGTCPDGCIAEPIA